MQLDKERLLTRITNVQDQIVANMKELQDLQKMINELNNSTSTNEKISTLEQYKGNVGVCKLLEYTHSQFKQFNVTPANCEKKSELITPTTHPDIFALLNDLHDRVITGNNAIGAVNAFTKKYPDYKELIYKILNRNLKTRVGTSLINRVIPNCIPVFNVALAQKYEAVAKNVDFETQEWFASRKLDGVRCITIVSPNGTVNCYSRAGKEFLTLDKIKTDIAAMGVRGVVFDGEVCLVDENGDEDFQGIMKEIRKKNHTIANPKFFVFDYLTLEEFDNQVGTTPLVERLKAGYDLLPETIDCSVLEFLPQEQISNDGQFTEMAKDAEEAGFEGIMVRKNVGYEGKRSHNLLKVKKFHDAEYTVLDAINGNIRWTENGKQIEKECLSSIIIEHKGCKVSVGSGFSKEQREMYYESPQDIIGKTVTIQYFEESKNQTGGYSLRFPVVKHIYANGRDC